MTRKETALDALNRKIPKLEETLEFEAFKKYLRDNGMTTEEAIAKLTASSEIAHEQKIITEDRKNAQR